MSGRRQNQPYARGQTTPTASEWQSPGGLSNYLGTQVRGTLVRRFTTEAQKRPQISRRNGSTSVVTTLGVSWLAVLKQPGALPSRNHRINSLLGVAEARNRRVSSSVTRRSSIENAGLTGSPTLAADQRLSVVGRRQHKRMLPATGWDTVPSPAVVRWHLFTHSVRSYFWLHRNRMLGVDPFAAR